MTPFEQKLIGFVGAAIVESAVAHARAEYPKESCGFVSAGQYIACENKATSPNEAFKIDDPRFDAAVVQSTLTCVIHSHPNGPSYPSEDDMVQQLATGVPWIILNVNESGVTNYIGWGGNLPTADLIGRPFLHGIFDCYSAVRDVFALGKDALATQGIAWPLAPIKLPEIPRDDAWWRKGQDLYHDNIAKQGFKIITRVEAKPGDGFLIKIGDARANPQQRLNHAGLLLEKEQIIHHLPLRVSRREPAGLWARAADLWVRYVGEPA
jgi:proteasome lid subunit RPN8/RPN11